MASLTIENYAKAIYQLTAAEEEAVSTGAVARRLSVAPGTVTAMLKTLREAGLAQYEPYEGVRLTDEGRRLALRVLRRHRLIELFLVHTLDLTWDEVHEEAENMEHAVSDRLVDRIDAFLGFPRSDPHGDPIPQADGTVDPVGGRSLATWPLDQPFRLVRVLDQSSEFLRYLTEAGLELGSGGVILQRHPHAGTVELEIGGERATLAHSVAGKLLVTARD